MRLRNIFIGLTLITILSLLALALLPKHSVQIFFGQMLAERGHYDLITKSYGPLTNHELDIYHPLDGEADETAPNNKPIIIFLYGGGWREGSRKIYEFVGAALAKNGYTTIIPDYRVHPEVSFPGFIDDAARAYHWVWKNIATNGVVSGNATRPIIVMGHSAGAHSAAMIALNRGYIAKYGPDTPLPAALIGISGPYAFDPTTWATTKDIFETASNADEARPSAHVNQSAPPALLMHGLKDTTVRMFNLETMAKNYRKAGRVVTIRTYANLSHIDIILTIARPLRWRASVFDDVTNFIKTYNKPAR